MAWTVISDNRHLWTKHLISALFRFPQHFTLLALAGQLLRRHRTVGYCTEKRREGDGNDTRKVSLVVATLFAVAGLAAAPRASAQDQKPNIVMLMTDDTGWNDFGAYSGGGAGLGHPTPNIDRLAKEGAVFTSWYGQASCTAGRASFITGRIPIRSALSIVVAPGDENYLRPETPTIAEYFKKNGYSTYFSGKWHLGDKPISYPINHGFDEMKEFAAYYAGVYSYPDTDKWFHPWFPSYNADFEKMLDSVVNLDEWEGVTGQPAKKVATITYDYMATMDERMADYAVTYIKDTPRAASHSSWTSTGSKCTIPPMRRPISEGRRTWATTPIP